MSIHVIRFLAVLEIFQYQPISLDLLNIFSDHFSTFLISISFKTNYFPEAIALIKAVTY